MKVEIINSDKRKLETKAAVGVVNQQLKLDGRKAYLYDLKIRELAQTKNLKACINYAK